jgi:hypothetical protein
MTGGMLSVAAAALFLFQAESARALIDRLGSEVEVERKDAAAKLEAFGKAAIDDLTWAISYSKPRTADLARGILTRIEARLAPETLEALTQALLKPKTCRFKVQVQIDFRGEKRETHEAEAVVIFSGADKVRVESKVTIENQRDRLTWICNGKNAYRKAEDDGWETMSAPTDIRKRTASAILGLSGPGALPWLNLNLPKDSPGRFSVLGVQPITRGTPEHCLLLQFVENPDTPEWTPMKGSLTYDPIALVPLTCTWTQIPTGQRRPATGRTTVTYQNFVFNGDVDEKLFSP